MMQHVQVMSADELQRRPGTVGVTYLLKDPPHTAYVWDGSAMRPLSLLSAQEAQANKAFVSGGGAVTSYEDFSTAPNGSPTFTDDGRPWVLTVGSGHGANAAMRVVSGKLTNTTTDAAARAGYAEFDAGAPISRVGARFTLSAGTSGGSATVVAWANSITASFAAAAGVPNTPLHLSITPTVYRLSYWIGGAETIILNNVPFATPLTNDGVTEYQVEMSRDGGQWSLLLPDGTAVTGFTSAIASIPAQWACIENFQVDASVNARAAFTRVWVRTAAAGADKFQRSVGDRSDANAYSRAVALAAAAQFGARSVSVDYAPGSADDKAITTTAAELDTTNLRVNFTFGAGGAAIVDMSGIVIAASGGLLLNAYVNGASVATVLSRRNATTNGSGEEFRGRVRITGAAGSTVNVGMGASVIAGSGSIRANGAVGHRICMTVTPA